MTSNEDTASPVLGTLIEPAPEQLEHGPALCLSGGGYRAMLFHLGTLWRLNEAGYLPRLRRISSVSGGSITAAVLGLAWRRLAFDSNGIGHQFEGEVAAPILRLASRTIDITAIVGGLLRGSANDQLAMAYRRFLFGDRTLQDLPDVDEGPLFVINAANLQSGVLWRFTKPYMRDYRVGEIARPSLPLAVAVAASSAFPPFLSPAILRFDPSAYVPASGQDLQQPPYTTRVHLTDGGVYDNLGLETVWKHFACVLVSDGGGHLGAAPSPRRDWILQLRRVLDVEDNQVRSLRKRQLIASYLAEPTSPSHRTGAYWGIRSNIADFGLPDALPASLELTTRLAHLPTRLARLSRLVQQQLVNWGFAACDAGLRRHVDPHLPRPRVFPYPDVSLTT